MLTMSRQPVHLADMDDHLVLAEDGKGLRIFRVPAAHHGHGEPRVAPAPLVELASISLDKTFTAVAAEGRRIFAATTDGPIAVFDAGQPAAPAMARWLPVAAGITALAANGDLLHVLRLDGLEILDLGVEPPRRLLLDPAVGGTSLSLAGRRLDVASGSGGLATYFNSTATAQVINVSVNNNFFSPEDIVIQPGDSVRWRNLSGFHNVVSCVPDQMGCDGQQADESFFSGPVLGPPWLFIYTFEEPGFNPYICIPHAPFMRGTVTIEAPPPPPLPVLVDVKPGSCVNPVNTRAQGVLPVAILGGDDLDVATITVETLRLAGIPPLRSALEDVGGPAAADAASGPCGTACPTGEPDGHLDLTLKFDQQQVLAALGPLADGQCVLLPLTGRLLHPAGERDLVGQDPVLILAPPRGRP
jgi:plastocyanin